MTSPHPFAAWVALSQSPTRPRRPRTAGRDRRTASAPRVPAQRRPDDS